MKKEDWVDDRGKDVGNSLGVDVLRWLVVGCWDVGEIFGQEASDGQTL